MITITVAQNKGGSAKTSTIFNLASILYEKGYRVLTVDADAQCNLSDAMSGTGDPIYGVPGTPSIVDLIEEDPLDIFEVIVHCNLCDCVPGDPLMRMADDILSEGEDGEYQYRLKKVFQNKKLQETYDFCLIDTAPAISRMLTVCLCAADKVLITSLPDRFSLQGLETLSEYLSNTKEIYAPNLDVVGILISRYNGRSVASRDVLYYMDQIVSNAIGVKTFKTVIPETVDVSTALLMHQPVNQYKNKSKASAAYRAFTDELLERIGE